MAGKDKVPYKLPSGKYIYVPGGLTTKQANEWVFKTLDDKPEFEEDRLRIGDDLETSGWGSTIGGTLGGIGGAIGGIFTSPSLVVNPLTLGAAGAGAGSAAGESIEQWLTGRGDYGDIGKAGLEGGAYGLIPGGGGQIAKNALKAGAGPAKAALKAGLANTGTGAVVGTGTAVATGNDPLAGAAGGGLVGATGSLPGGRLVGEVAGGLLRGTGAKLAQKAGKELFGGSSNGLTKDLTDAAQQYATGFVKKKAGRPTGGFTMAAAKLDMRRAIVGSLARKAKDVLKRGLTPDETKLIDELAESAAARAIRDQTEHKTAAAIGRGSSIDDLRLAEIKDDIAFKRIKPKKVDLGDGVERQLIESDGAYFTPDGEIFSLNKGGKLSDKIGLLRREGYPQDQAVAIAHSYKKRGMLK